MALEKRQKEVEEQRKKQAEERKARENFDLQAELAVEDDYRHTQDYGRSSSRYDRRDDRRGRDDRGRGSSGDYNKRDRNSRRNMDEDELAEMEDAALTEKEKQAIRVCIADCF